MSGLIGQSLGRYQIVELIGEGGMATVYKARDARLDRDVAIKFIRPEAVPPDQFEIILKRFEREAKSLAGLSHPNIVGVIDYGEHDGLPYLVMVYLPGGTLKERLGAPMYWRDAVRFIIPVARALEYTHEHSIINRDVKPSNILLTEKGQPMLTDFGLVKIFEGKNATHLTASGAGLGTPDYMAPEQWIGEATAASDQYSLGVVLYEMITGHRPYISDTPAGILLKQINDPLPFPKTYIPDLPQSVESVLMKVLARKPTDRYADMHAFANELQNLLDGREVTATGIKTKQLREQMTGQIEKPKLEQKPAEEEKAPEKTHLQADQKPASPADPQPASPKKKISSPWLAVLGGFVLLGLCGACWLLNARFNFFGGTTNPTATQSVTLATDVPTEEVVEEILPTETSQPASEPTEAPATEISLPAEITDGKNISMRLVPAGEFIMGNDDGNTEESPASKVQVAAFYMDKYEVTNDMYAECVAAGVCKLPEKPGSATRSSYYNNPSFANYPVLYVNWTMAKTYCEWRDARLPTEAEWEKAARGMDDQRAYPWGNDFNCNFANHSGCVGDTAPVNQYNSGQSPYGIYGLSGNVWEWTSSLFAFYPYSATDGREDPTATGFRSVRGGSWNIFGGSGGNIRIDTRYKLDPVYFGAYVGFRCALTK
ncbi:MAG TPA: SUMF1/EgtB/PvdO family nonheme iron enzyme [Anaerolineales bacterium]|nr:SUMF1/EgtB/PvdO family nonheme iron enzyme [Anaerolineales bacterium]